ncbi:MAG: GspH/FimT family pseudopilin [Gammaproteobacteria bacterium]|nr:GspH/FimT family pseudopilin [Gammaproteobacteria bacterium]MBT8106281.1 GspH/FimT family pseudopilin [Gammaproteobacteria bacterium]NNF48685.1 prepilin-type N-terminal cleavage/methylation domain-containing protein [Woeseiaceae bacterium]NNK26295.1 prepilin-type N-terminal cleavage/methylation domain-containing protein [Woeseiaceae bacterium]
MQAIHRGFTLYELLITLGLVAMLGMLAVPAFVTLSAKTRQYTEISALFHAIHRARKTSIVQRREVSLCPSDDGATCAKRTDWSAGWILYYAPDGDDPGDLVVVAHAVADSIRIRANRRAFTLRATVKRATNGTLVVCDSRGRIPPKALVVSFTGRPRVATARPDGTAYSCVH